MSLLQDPTKTAASEEGHQIEGYGLQQEHSYSQTKKPESKRRQLMNLLELSLKCIQQDTGR